MKKTTKYLFGFLAIFLFIVMFLNDFKLWKIFGAERKEIVYTKGKLCTYSTQYVVGFEVGRDTVCVKTNN